MALELKILGKCDINSKGAVSGEYPAWYFDAQVEEIQKSIHNLSIQLEHGGIPANAIAVTKNELRQKKERLAEIDASRPKLKGGQIDAVRAVRDELGKEISDSMFSYTDMQKGIASPREEANRMTQPIISVPVNARGMAEQMGMRVKGGKVSRDDATRLWKISGKMLGEATHPEALRKDNNYGRYQQGRSLDELARE